MTTEEEIVYLRHRGMQLQNIIDKFKEYDEKRQKFYSQALQKLGALEAFIEETEKDGTKLIVKIKEVATANKRLREIIAASNIDPEERDMDKVSLQAKVVELKRHNDTLRDRLRKFQVEQQRLICENARLRMEMMRNGEKKE